MATTLRAIGDKMHQASEAEAVYIQLGALLSAQPDLAAVNDRLAIPDATLRWLGEVSAIVTRLDSITDSVELNAAVSLLIQQKGRGEHAEKIKMILYRCLALAQQRAPATAQSAFIATGADFDAFAALHRVFQEAESAILIVDPYMDETVLTSFGVLAKPQVSIALLADEAGMRAALEPAARAWIAQYGAERHLAVRKAEPRTLHDRIILVDQDKAWILTQSLKDFAARSPATIQRVDSQLARMKFDAYERIWNASAVVAQTVAKA